MDVHSALIAVTSSLLRSQKLASQPPPTSGMLRLSAPPALDPNGELSTEDLWRLGCSKAAIGHLQALYQRYAGVLAQEHLQSYAGTATQLASLFGRDEETTFRSYEVSLSRAVTRSYAEQTSVIRQRILDEVRAAQLRHSLSPPAPPSPESPPTGRPKQFTAEVLAILEAAFEASDSVSRGERRELANVTGLTERQVLTWFANQRQRRNKKKERRVQGAPYVRPDLAVPTTPTSRIRAPIHGHQQRRTVSGSSFGSSGSSLVEYAEQDLVLPPLDPSVQQPLFLPDVPVLGDVTAPTPIAASFFATPSSSRFDCSASSVSSTIDDCSIPQPPRATYDPSSLFSTSPSNASTSSLDLPPLDAPFEPAVVQAPAPTDAWMDDQFYRNLFGSLGLDSGEGGAGLEADGAGEGGGLTLSLDAVRAELEGMQGVEADLSFLF